MSGTTEELRRRIGGAENLAGVVRSMKAIAASSISQYERAVESLHDYARTVELGLAAGLCASGARALLGPSSHRQVKIGAIVFGSDQGLVGRFNEVAVDFAWQAIGALPGQIAKIWTIGERIGGLVEEMKSSTPAKLQLAGSVEGITGLVGKLIVDLEAALERGTITEVHVFHNHPVSPTRYEPTGIRLLPFDRAWEQKAAQLRWPTRGPPEILEGAKAALPAFLRSYLFVSLFQACAESLASENACRLAAMQRAEKNIGSILEELKRTYHQIRQESIDEELFDVIAGFEARRK